MNQVVQFQEPRLPYHSAVKDRFGVDKGAWKVLAEAIFPSAKTQEAVVMALAYCQARKLDVFKKPVHIVPMWSTAKGAMVETVWPAISELRTTAFRTGQYVGLDATDFGPDITQTFKGRTKGRDAEDVEVTVTFPQWARCTVHRILDGVERKFVGPKVYWLEDFSRLGGIEVPNGMWAKRPSGQLEKCAEAGALRRAFPEEIGNQLTAEEMEGKTLSSETQPSISPPSAPTAPAAPKVVEQQKQEPEAITEFGVPDAYAAGEDDYEAGKTLADMPPHIKQFPELEEAYTSGWQSKAPGAGE